MIPGEEAPRCGNPACARLQQGEWQKMFLEGAPWHQMQALECDVCKQERQERSRVIMGESDPRCLQPPFDAAPYIHPYNLPKYFALQLRAVEFAKQRNLCVNWVVARDAPRHRDDQALSTEALDQKRKVWLTYHDQQTAGIMGLLPLIQGLPVRLTETINKGLKLYKHRSGTVVGWTLHPDESSAVEGSERNLTHHPLCIYVKFDNAAWQIDDLEASRFLFKRASQ